MHNRIFNLLAAVLLLGATAFAHHAFSNEFDDTKPVTLEGVVTQINWENPHVYFYVDVKESDGTVVNWACETRGPSGLARRGWKRDSLKIGDKVVVTGFRARNGTHTADGRQVSMADGRKILSDSANY
jgi:hypothetical protein